MPRGFTKRFARSGPCRDQGFCGGREKAGIDRRLVPLLATVKRCVLRGASFRCNMMKHGGNGATAPVLFSPWFPCGASRMRRAFLVHSRLTHCGICSISPISVQVPSIHPWGILRCHPTFSPVRRLPTLQDAPNPRAPSLWNSSVARATMLTRSGHRTRSRSRPRCRASSLFRESGRSAATA